MTGTFVMHREPHGSGVCEWYPGNDGCPGGDGIGGTGCVYCAGGVWVLIVQHESGHQCIYQKPAATYPTTTPGATTTTSEGATTPAPPLPDCPWGLYMLESGDCVDCPETITVYG